jgi:acyl-coenzyme A synthetase/AMP-(fatty) acid ligase
MLDPLLNVIAALAGLCIGALIVACFDENRSDELRKRLEACEAEIARLQKRRDSRGRFTK